MKKIAVKIKNKQVGELFIEEHNCYGFNYADNAEPISLIMPYNSMFQFF